jgi:alcohol dehydrogenase class IV
MGSKIWCDDRKAARMDMIGFTYDALPGRVVFALGAARRSLAGEIERLGVTRLLLISTTTEAELAKEIASPLGDRVAGTFTDVRPHVPVAVAEAAQSAAEDVGAQALLSIGGGSTTGTAKAIALRTGLPIIAVPTTYAGSEMTPVWGLTEGGEKRTGVDSRVLPRVVMYDPELTFSLPVALSAASGLNALAHCVEAFWAPGRNPITSLMAEEGIRALAQGLPGVVDQPKDPTARSRALYGAYLAGASFAVAGSGLHHKICHVLGGTFDLPHAETHAVVLPYVLAFNEPALGDAAAPIARAFGSTTPLAGLLALGRQVGAPRSLSELGMPKDGLERAAALVGAKLPFENPRPIRVSDVLSLLEYAWEGLEPCTPTLS